MARSAGRSSSMNGRHGGRSRSRGYPSIGQCKAGVDYGGQPLGRESCMLTPACGSLVFDEGGSDVPDVTLLPLSRGHHVRSFVTKRHARYECSTGRV